ncbi:MAG: asparagine synthase (glutamine-hydrolyzing) [Bauldia sp.]|nr:asparagine synthase (glutamine-hydrolyzing) [Bauldia sp.]
MCGIAGYLGDVRSEAEGRAVLGAMIGAIRHRGPDGTGIVAEEGIGLAHARLSIIDLAAGAQPMASADGRLEITFNGEIFNYVELRAELLARGHRFRTHSDTEVILNLYAEMGPACVERLNGDFTFAIWDRPARTLFIARDRMGVRPLFHTTRNGVLYFGSEVKALLAVPGVSAELDPIALDQIFTFWFPLAPRTAFKDVLELPPGHTLTATADGRVAIRRYWALDYPDAADADGLDQRPDAAIADDVRALLEDAARIRLRADVPVGSYLSGGLDSSLITAIARREVSDRLRTFSVGFESAEYDEAEQQMAMVQALGTEHSSILCTTADIGRVMPDVIRATERPILRTSPAPLFRLSGLVRDSGFKVVLTGEGADEVFAGYDIFKEAKVRRFAARNPASTWRPLLLQRLYPYLPRLQNQPQAFLQSFFGRPEDAADPLFSHLPRFRTTAGAKLFYAAETRRQLAGYSAMDELRSLLPERFARWHPLSQAQYLEAGHLLPGYILSSQGDRVAMAHAVEGRFPFLDHRVVEFASRIPPRLKLRSLREKHILREAAAPLLPKTIANRVKQPYRAPEVAPFVGAGAPAYVADRLAPGAIAASGLFDPVAVGRLAAKVSRNGEVGFKDNMAFLGVLTTELWLDAFAPARSSAPPRSVAAA